MPKPPPRLTSGGVAPICVGKLGRERDSGALGLDQRLRRRAPGEPAKMWKPRHSAPAASDALTSAGTRVGIDPERLGAAAHPHARALDLEIGIDPDRQPGPAPELAGDRQRALDLALAIRG